MFTIILKYPIIVGKPMDEDIVSLGFEMHGPTHRAMKMEAVKNYMKIPQVYRAACKEYLEKRGIKVD